MPEPVSLALTLAPLRHGPFDPTCRFGRGEVWWSLRTGDGPATIQLVEADDRRSVRAEVWGPGGPALLEGAPGLIGLGDDPSSFRPAHPVVARLHRRNRGLRIPRSGQVFAALAPAVLEQRVTSGQAHREWGAIVRAFGSPAPGPADLRLAPAPETVAAIPYHVLHRFGVEQRRAATLQRVARHARRLQEAADMPLADAYRRIRAVSGVGAWTAAVVGQVALGDADAVRLGDFHLPNQVAWALAGEPRADDARMLELLGPYAGHRARVCRLIVAGGVRAPAFGPRRRVLSIASL